MRNIAIISIVVFSILYTNRVNAQIDSLINHYSTFLKSPFVSDGQQYRAMITSDETAEFRATFYGGSTYRIIGFSNVYEQKIVYKVYDKERNILFSSADYDNPEFWDFQFKSTIDCIIEAELLTERQASGLVVLLIGFKQH